MTDLEPIQVGVFILVGLLALLVVAYSVSLIALLPPLRKEAQQNKSIRITLVFTLGFVVCMFVFLVVTRLETETSFESPPHGVVSGLWDDFENMQGGALFLDEKTQEELIWKDNDLQYISQERFLRYIRPPFIRNHCYTHHSVACRWTDIDLTNFDDQKEWVDFLIRLTIGMASGAVTGFITWRNTGSKEVIRALEAG